MFLHIFAIFVTLFCATDGKYVEGEIHDESDWIFITRFCFLSRKGTMKFYFEYPVSYGPQNVLLYFDDATQWEAVYKTDKTCAQKEAVLSTDANQIIYLTTAYGLSGCKIEEIDGELYYQCTGGRTFASSRERWWYIALSRCNRDPADPVGVKLKYRIHMTNGRDDDYLHKEYSADEFYILPIDVVALCLYAILMALTVVCAIVLRNRQLWHSTYKLYMISVGVWLVHLIFMSIAYGIYGNDGLPDPLSKIKLTGRVFESVSILVFLVMLLLVAKGYTITRGKLRAISTIKLSVFFTLYTVAYCTVFIYEAMVFDPGLVLYTYESPPGYGLIVLRIVGWLWFLYAIVFTLKHYPEKKPFYYPLFIFYTIWFWSGPIMILVASFAIPAWMREKTVNGVEQFIALAGHLFFLILTRPQAANKNFPYHVRTTQIGIMANVPHVLQSNRSSYGSELGNYGSGAYAISTSPTSSETSGPDFSNLFVTSKTRSESTTSLMTRNSSEQSFTGMQRHSFSSVPPPAAGDPSPWRRHSSTTSFGAMSTSNSTAELIPSELEPINDMSLPNSPRNPTSPRTKMFSISED